MAWNPHTLRHPDEKGLHHEPDPCIVDQYIETPCLFGYPRKKRRNLLVVLMVANDGDTFTATRKWWRPRTARARW